MLSFWVSDFITQVLFIFHTTLNIKLTSMFALSFHCSFSLLYILFQLPTILYSFQNITMLLFISNFQKNTLSSTTGAAIELGFMFTFFGSIKKVCNMIHTNQSTKFLSTWVLLSLNRSSNWRSYDFLSIMFPCLYITCFSYGTVLYRLLVMLAIFYCYYYMFCQES